MSSEENKKWLYELPTNDLIAAKTWPIWMLYILHPSGFLLAMTFTWLLFNNSVIIALPVLSLMCWVAHQAYQYLGEVKLINNELLRRVKLYKYSDS